MIKIEGTLITMNGTDSELVTEIACLIASLELLDKKHLLEAADKYVPALSVESKIIMKGVSTDD